jgi:MFS transporter, MHS family, citrate/tricarballylate:H+ symporter
MPTQADRVQARRAIVAATVGNALEFYDFMIFTFFAIQIGDAFFPSTDAFARLMASLATFGIGFISRPVGAWVIGGYADRHGRKPALMLSMILMGVAIAVMALTPGFAAIGIAAPIIVVLARLVQGFAVGGEVGPATAYMMENASEGRRGVVVGLQRVSQLIAGTAGSLVGLVLTLMMSASQFAAYGWRVAMLLGVAIVPYAILIRSRLPETAHVVEPPSPVIERPQKGIRQIYVIGPILISAGTISSYVVTYLATFGQASLKLSNTVALGGQVLANLAALITCIISGWASDHVGRRPALITAILAQIILIPLSIAWMVGQASLLAFFAGSILLSGATGAFPSPANAAIVESLPKASRSRSFSLMFAIPVTIFGATTQMVVTWLIHRTGDDLMVAWYPLAALVVALIASLRLRESAPLRLQTA